MDEMLEGIEGATAIMDDILIAGRDRDHHEGNLIPRSVIEKTTQHNLKLDFEKCKVRITSVPYVGHLSPQKE